MNVIESAVNKNADSTKYENLKKQTWESFYAETKDKKVYLFGCGSGASYFAYKCAHKVTLEGIIDNDKSKIGQKISCYFSNIDLSVEEISDVSALDKCPSEEIAVLITSTLYYEKIYEQLKEKGIENVYSLLHMEVNENKYSENEEDKREYEIKENKLIFYTRGSYSGHCRYIAEALLKIRKDLDLVWIVNDLSIKVPEGIRKIYERINGTVEYEMKTAKVWVYETLVPVNYAKSEGQIYIQTKHWSSVTLKTFGVDLNKFRNASEGVKRCRNNGAMMDYMFFGSDFDEETCRKGYEFKGKGIRVGSPRSDILFNSVNIRSEVYKACGINEAEHTLLYAPTFSYVDTPNGMIPEMRDTAPDFAMLKNALEKRFGGEWKILLRLHPWVADKSSKIVKPEYVIDVSKYSDSQELVAASDAMVTDYSSIMFEPAFVHKPVFLFASDRKEFINVEREMLIDYDTLPFSIAETDEELSENIALFDNKKYIDNIDKFMEKYGVHEDGRASERAAKFISDIIDGKEV